MSDIVSKLRLLAQGLVPVRNQIAMREAADEIERLRENLKDAQMLAVVRRAERDEARREVCCAETTGETQGFALLYAKSRGWDCFDVTKRQPPAAQTDEASQEDGA